MGEPTSFLDIKTLNTLVGQVGAVLMLTQVVRATFPGISTYALRLFSVAAGISLHAVLVWAAGMTHVAYVLALLNGTLVAMVAMKSAELIKGESRAPASEPQPKLPSETAPGSSLVSSPALILPLVVALALTGCTAKTQQLVCFDRGQAGYALGEATSIIEGRCAAKKLTEAQCARLAEIGEHAKRAVLTPPEESSSVDYEAVMKFLLGAAKFAL